MTAPYTFEDVREYAERHDEVLGLVLFGSRGRDLGVDEHSDWDVLLVARDDWTAARLRARFPSVHGAAVEVFVETPATLAEAGALGGSDEWRRYLYAHLTPLVDRTGGELQTVLDAKELVPDAARTSRATGAVDAFVTAAYRARRYGTQLDAAEAAFQLLEAAFALGGRIRPYNKYLAWELEHHPLDGWPAGETLALVGALLAGEGSALVEAFRSVERGARAAGVGDAIDGWEPDVAWLRGEAPFRP